MNEPIETQQPLPEVHTVQLRLGEPVSALDGPFGELADIVIDPHSRVVTHVVIEPRHHHYQARLVPIGDEEALRERVFDGTEDVLAMPYSWGSTAMTSYDDSAAMIQWDRVPKGECEVRRSSAVLVDGGQCIGHVAGFVADGTEFVHHFAGGRHLVVRFQHLVFTDSISNLTDFGTRNSCFEQQGYKNFAVAPTTSLMDCRSATQSNWKARWAITHAPFVSIWTACSTTGGSTTDSAARTGCCSSAQPQIDRSHSRVTCFN